MEEYFQKFFDPSLKSLESYFKSMIELISLMCLSRNYAGINTLEDENSEFYYSLEFNIDYFMSKKVSLDLRANLAKMLVSLHIDKDPLEYLNIPIMTRTW